MRRNYKKQNKMNNKYTSKKRNFKGVGTGKNLAKIKNVIKKPEPVGVSIRFIHWNWDTRKIDKVSYKAYRFKVTEKELKMLKKNGVTKGLVVALFDNNVYKVAVIEKWFFNDLDMLFADSVLPVANKEGYKQKGIPKSLNYSNVKDLHNDLVKLIKLNQDNFK